jgi:glycosyltransferase involved in cell wall biosynthesis
MTRATERTPEPSSPSGRAVKPLRIAYLSTEMGLGGAETIGRSLFDEWRALGHEPHLVLTYEPGVIAERMAQDGHPVTALGLPRSLKILGHINRVRKALREIAPDVIVMHNQDALLPWAWTLGKVVAGKRVPVIAAVHSSAAGPIRMTDRIHRFFLPRFERVIVLGGPHARYAHERFGVPQNKLTIIHNGVTPKPERDLERPLPELPANAVTGFIAARLHPEKNHRMLLQATQSVVRGHPEFHLLVAGQGELRAELEAYTNELGISRNVHFLGARGDVSAILDRAHIGILSSINETFSVAVLEYMRAGLPVIATRTGSLEDQVKDGVTGFLVPPRDAQALSNALERLVADSALRERLGQAGRELQSREFTARGMSEAYLALFSGRAEAQNGR